MHQFVDADGNLAQLIGSNGVEADNGGEGLGAAAGSRRTAAEFEDAEAEDGRAGEETKWRRTG